LPSDFGIDSDDRPTLESFSENSTVVLSADRYSMAPLRSAAGSALCFTRKSLCHFTRSPAWAWAMWPVIVGNSTFVGSSSWKRMLPTATFLVPCLMVNESIFLVPWTLTPSMRRRKPAVCHSFCLVPVSGLSFWLSPGLISMRSGWNLIFRKLASLEVPSSPGNVVSVMSAS
jgi:hypothetical protein